MYSSIVFVGNPVATARVDLSDLGNALCLLQCCEYLFHACESLFVFSSTKVRKPYSFFMM